MLAVCINEPLVFQPLICPEQNKNSMLKSIQEPPQLVTTLKVPFKQHTTTASVNIKQSITKYTNHDNKKCFSIYPLTDLAFAPHWFKMLHDTVSILALECGDTSAILLTSLAKVTWTSNHHNNSKTKESTVPAEPPNTMGLLPTSSRASSFNGFLDFLLIFPPKLREAINVCVGHNSSPLPEAAVVVPVRDFAIKHGWLAKKHIRPRWNNSCRIKGKNKTESKIKRSTWGNTHDFLFPFSFKSKDGYYLGQSLRRKSNKTDKLLERCSQRG